MLTEGRRSPKHYQPGSLSSRVAELIGQRPEGISASALAAAFPGEDVHTCLSGLVRAARVTRPRRAVYVLADPAEVERPLARRAGHGALHPHHLRPGGAVVRWGQGMLPRNVIALVERPPDATADEEAARPAKSLTVDEVEAFRESVRDERLFACWLLSCYGLRRSEVLGLRWSQLDDHALRVRRGRVAVGSETEEGLPKSRRSRRDLPPPPELAEALRTLEDVPEGRGAGAWRRVVG